MDNNLNFTEKISKNENIQKISDENIKDITDDIQKQNIQFNGKKLTDIFKEIEEKPELKNYNNLRIIRNENFFSLQNEEKNSEYYLFFKKHITIHIL